MSIRRLFINPYLTYSSNSGQSLTNFTVNFPTSINHPKDVTIMGASLLFYPKYPNFTPKENKVYMTVVISSVTYNIVITIPPELVYVTPSNPSGTNTQDELNRPVNIVSDPALPTDFGTDVGEFIYVTNDQNFNFEAVAVNDIRFVDGANNAYRRLGLSGSFLNVNINTLSFGTLDFGNPPILARSQVLYICSNLSNDSMINGLTSYGSNIMAQIPVNGGFGDIISYEPTSNWGKLDKPRSFSSITFTILDDTFEPILFSSNANLLIALQIQYDENNNSNTGRIKNVIL